ncbi:FAD-dependent monooxygenase [Pochonia chlamydosporia 170]|uniref:FAD-dependent monooxygenase n=1 Tax=Pochonia chlamydosporia 170 TaxID=1380566 RepID=A0A179FDE2_METCM|nr:FAD-dependent monooxygenase [Pochonia chlamydosporia 170]OAQ63311.2 FAD-dependent monooxygenase [Pochonia chlamydosporia 170]
MQNRYEIAIIGGGIAGLTTALICEKLNFTYILLEKQASFEEDKGAGVGIQPNGLRILDQLGLAARLEDEAGALAEMYRYDGTGRLIIRNSFLAAWRERLGYDYVFTERATLRRMLWESVKRRECIKAPCLVTSIEEHDDYVIVHAENASYTADLVVGADGVKSCVRGHIDALKPVDEYISTPFTCTYGMSSPTHGLLPGDHFGVYNTNSSILGFTDKNGIIYWFIFEHINVPKARYTASDADESCASVSHLRIMPAATFTSINTNTIRKFKVPLQEYTAPNWHTHRTVLVGDAACKISPANGMGACQALEMSAALMNQLTRLRRHANHGIWSRDELHASLERYSEIRRPAAVATLEKARLITEVLLCVEGKPVGVLEQMKRLEEGLFLRQALGNWVGAPVILGLRVTGRGVVLGDAIERERKLRERDVNRTGKL